MNPYERKPIYFLSTGDLSGAGDHILRLAQRGRNIRLLNLNRDPWRERVPDIVGPLGHGKLLPNKIWKVELIDGEVEYCHYREDAARLVGFDG